MSGFVHETSVGNSVEWFTPAWVFDALGATFDLDPCTPGVEHTHVPATHCLSTMGYAIRGAATCGLIRRMVAASTGG